MFLATYTMFKLMHELENKFLYCILRIIRGQFGHAAFARIDDISIELETTNFIIVNKHHDVVINHNDKNVAVTVEKQLERLFPDLYNPKLFLGYYFCHRLDYATSGLLCIAKNKYSCAAASEAFAKRRSQKYYIAILRGLVNGDYVKVDIPIGDDIREKFRSIRMAPKTSPFCSRKTREALTHFAVLERGYCYGYPATKVLMRPVTGRRHQLRIHCSELGHTIVGDYTYSNRRDIVPYRMFLHAFRLVLPNDLEHLDVQTKDPFTMCDYRNNWHPTEYVRTLADASSFLENINENKVDSYS